jgi:hypothetical protein
MGLVSAQGFVQSILTGLTPPGKTGIKGPIDSLITPLDPDVNPDGIARVYVWPARGPGKRIAQPRNNPATGSPGATKQTKHDLQVFMTWMDSPNDQDADVNFPALIDFVWKILETCPSPQLWTDPETGGVSQMVNLGEVMTYEFIPPRTLEPQKMRRYDARIMCTLLEIYQA